MSRRKSRQPCPSSPVGSYGQARFLPSLWQRRIFFRDPEAFFLSHWSHNYPGTPAVYRRTAYAHARLKLLQARHSNVFSVLLPDMGIWKSTEICMTGQYSQVIFLCIRPNLHVYLRYAYICTSHFGTLILSKLLQGFYPLVPSMKTSNA